MLENLGLQGLEEQEVLSGYLVGVEEHCHCLELEDLCYLGVLGRFGLKNLVYLGVLVEASEVVVLEVVLQEVQAQVLAEQFQEEGA